MRESLQGALERGCELPVPCRLRRRLSLLLLFQGLLLAVLLSGCTADPEDLTGMWGGALTLVRDDRSERIPVDLRLQQNGPTLGGYLQAREVTGARRSFPGRRFDLTEGLASEGKVFFHARTQLATGTATVVFHGEVQGDRLDGEATVDLSTTEGEVTLPGELTVQRRREDRS